MTDEINIDCWLLIVDTDTYSGNFERQLTAYLTGQLGECGVGKEMAKLFEEEAKTNKPPVDFAEVVVSAPDDHGCSRPCTIYPTPGWYNDGVGNHFQAGDQKKALESYKTMMGWEIARLGKMYEGYLKVMPPGWTEKAVQKELVALEKRKKALKALKKLDTCSAYQSVAIFFSERPSKKTIAWLKKRAEGYPEARRKEWALSKLLKITGWRLIEHRVTRRLKVEIV